VVQSAWTQTMASGPVAAAAVADPDVAARFVLQHECEIFRTHRWRDAALNIASAYDAFHHTRAEFSFVGCVHRRGIFALEIQCGFAVECGGGLLTNSSHPGLDEIQGFVGEGAYSASYRRFGGDDVVGRSRMDLCHAQHGRV